MRGRDSLSSTAMRLLFEFVLEVAGEEHSIYGRIYSDDVIEIRRRGQSGGIEVERLANNNPVIIFDDDRVMIRQHGEWALVRQHFALLVSALVTSAMVLAR